MARKKVIKRCPKGHPMEALWVRCPKCGGGKPGLKTGRSFEDMTMFLEPEDDGANETVIVSPSVSRTGSIPPARGGARVTPPASPPPAPAPPAWAGSAGAPAPPPAAHPAWAGPPVTPSHAPPPPPAAAPAPPPVQHPAWAGPPAPSAAVPPAHPAWAGPPAPAAAPPPVQHPAWAGPPAAPTPAAPPPAAAPPAHPAWAGPPAVPVTREPSPPPPPAIEPPPASPPAIEPPPAEPPAIEPPPAQPPAIEPPPHPAMPGTRPPAVDPPAPKLPPQKSANEISQAPQRSRAKLECTGGPLNGRLFMLVAGVYRIGKQPRELPDSKSIKILGDQWLSKDHAVILVEGDEVVFTDPGSTNGSFINGEKVARAVLQTGDEIRLGETVFKFTLLGT